jgi:peroxiredoxin
MGAGGVIAAPQETQPADQEKKAPTAKVGEPAPDFTLQDAAGKSYRLADYKGKIVVLQWINPDCPVCRRVNSTGRVADMLTKVRETDENVVHLTINSTYYMEAEKSAAYLEKHKIDAPALIDQDGKVGKLYDARTTPHMYVIDAEGVLRYDGAFDDDRRGDASEPTNYVVEAVSRISAGDTVSPDKTRPYGCSVKYADGGGKGQGKGKGRRGGRGGGRGASDR